MVKIQHFYRGKLIVDNSARGEFKILATSKDINIDIASNLFSSAYLGSYNGVNLDDFNSAIVWGKYGEYYTLTKVEKSKILERGAYFPVYHSLIFTEKQIKQNKIDKFALTNWVLNNNLSNTIFSEVKKDLEPIELDLQSLRPYETDAMQDNLPQDVENLVLNFFFHNQQLSIANLPDNLSFRLNFLHNIEQAVPRSFRDEVTFATHVLNNHDGVVNVIFQLLLNSTSKPDINMSIYDWKKSKLDIHEELPFCSYLKWRNTRSKLDFDAIDDMLRTILDQYPKASRYDIMEILGQHLLLIDAGSSPSIELLHFNLIHNPILDQKQKKRLALQLMSLAVENNRFHFLNVFVDQNLIKSWFKELRMQFGKFSPNQKLSALLYWLELDNINNDDRLDVIDFVLPFLESMISSLASSPENISIVLDVLIRADNLQKVTDLLVGMINITKGEIVERLKDYLIALDGIIVDKILLQMEKSGVENSKWLVNLYYYIGLDYPLQKLQFEWLATQRLQGINLFDQRFDLQILRQTSFNLKEQLLHLYLGEAQTIEKTIAKTEFVTDVIEAFYYDPSIITFLPFSYESRDLFKAIDTSHQMLRQFNDFFSAESKLTEDEFQYLHDLLLQQISQISQGEREALAEKCIQLAEYTEKKTGGLFNRGSQRKFLSQDLRPKTVDEVFLWIAGNLLKEGNI